MTDIKKYNKKRQHIVIKKTLLHASNDCAHTYGYVQCTKSFI